MTANILLDKKSSIAPLISNWRKIVMSTFGANDYGYDAIKSWCIRQSWFGHGD